ncbi:hypothetical protein QR680_005384 [Steinernema hermaphroditum]|uniref:Uncharacterized protein n=1 Tax=Steinernema hermaphroditum TaxID=289476 RepID=A0AA39HRT6_9BILA|nr:hypothetical protein QR680_005384 [Steinernema hermaphroditum]
MQLAFSAAIVAFLLSLNFMIVSSQGVECYAMGAPPTGGQPSYGQGYGNYYSYGTPMTCGAQAFSCYKFVCAGPQFYIQKGCLDLQDPRSRCETMQAECQGRQGYGQCYTCHTRWCNGASSSSLSFLATGGALLLALLFRS